MRSILSKIDTQWWAIAAAMLFLIIIGYTVIDQPITLYFSKLPSNVARIANDFAWVIAPGTHLIAWPILFFCLYYLLHKQKAMCLILFVIAIPSTLFAIEILKVIFGRARPEDWLHQGIYGFQWLQSKNLFFSFPSAHSGTTGAIFGSLACFYPRKRILLMALTIVIAFDRVIAIHHFFSDVLAGVLIAFILAALIHSAIVKHHRI
jgi:membrane-associated phospholipid phosphatase